MSALSGLKPFVNCWPREMSDRVDKRLTCNSQRNRNRCAMIVAGRLQCIDVAVRDLGALCRNRGRKPAHCLKLRVLQSSTIAQRIDNILRRADLRRKRRMNRHAIVGTVGSARRCEGYLLGNGIQRGCTERFQQVQVGTKHGWLRCKSNRRPYDQAPNLRTRSSHESLCHLANKTGLQAVVVTEANRS